MKTESACNHVVVGVAGATSCGVRGGVIATAIVSVNGTIRIPVSLCRRRNW